MNSYAYKNRHNLPGQASSLDSREPSGRAFAEAQRTQEAGRGSSMVANDRPAPAPRPSADIASGPDRAAFNARWDREADRAADEREERKAAFKQARGNQKARGRKRTRSINR